MPANTNPIELIGIVKEKSGSPRDDSAVKLPLYSVVIKLSAPPTPEWVDAFLAAWENPSSGLTYHRPCIARVEGDELTLSETTVNEVEDTFMPKLKWASDKANQVVMAKQGKRG